MAKNGFLKSIWNWLTGNTKYGNRIVDALMTSGPLSYNSNKVTGEVSGGLSSLVNRVTQDDLTGAESAQNAFNAEQAQLNRDWQERMSNTAYQRSIADMKAAGVNPAMAMANGSSGASTPSGAAASGSLGSSPIGLSELMELATLKKRMSSMDADIRLKDSQAFYNEAAAGAQRASAGLSGAQRELVQKQVLAFDPMNKAQLDNLQSDLETKAVQRRLHESGISLNDAQKELALNNAALSAIDAKTRHQLNQLNARLRISELGLNAARTNEIKASINELYQRAILEAAQAGLYDQQARNLLVEQGILLLDKEQKVFAVNHQKSDRNWRIAGQVVSSIVGVAGATAGIMTGAGLAGRFASSAASSIARPSNIISPGTYDAFNAYVQSTRR